MFQGKTNKDSVNPKDTGLSFLTKALMILVPTLIYVGVHTYQAVQGSAIFGLTLNTPSLEDGLVGHWTFDGGTINGTTVSDQSGQGNDGTMTNGPTPTIGKIGQGMSFDGSSGQDNYINVPDNSSLEPTSAISFGAWFTLEQVNGAGEWSAVLSKGNNIQYTLMQDQNGTKMLGYLNTSEGQSWCTASNQGNFDINTWYHVMVTYNDDVDEIKIYVNGELDNTCVRGGVINTSAENLFIGSFDNNGIDWNYHDGLIDDVRIYNRALSAEEVQKLYRLGEGTKINSAASQSVPVLETGLVGHWTFDGSTINGATTTDQSGQGNDGLMVNGPTPTIGKLGQGMSFDGVDDYVSLSNVDLGVVAPNAGTVCAWHNPNSLYNDGSIQWIVNKDTTNPQDEFQMGKYSNNSLYFGFYMIAGGSRRYITTANSDKWKQNTWMYYCTTWGGDEIAGWIDGQKIGTSSFSIVVPANMKLHIGAQATGKFYDGLIDDVRIYNRALSASEVDQLYQLGKPAKINSAASQSVPTLETGLVGHWTFDGSTINGTTVSDQSGQGNDGTMVNGPTPTIGKLGQGMSFDGVNDYGRVSYDSSLSSATDITYSFWVRPNINDGKGLLGSLNGEDGTIYNYIYIDNAGTELNHPSVVMKRSIGGSVTNRQVSFSSKTNQWIFITYTYNGSYERIFINGSKLGEWSQTGNFASNTEYGLVFGRSCSTPCTSFKGVLDDVRIYNRALSAEEIQLLYKMGAR